MSEGVLRIIQIKFFLFLNENMCCDPSLEPLRNDVKRSVWQKQDGVDINRFCYHYVVCLQNAKRLSAGWNLTEIESAMEEKLNKCNQFFLGKLPAGKLFCKFHTTTKRRGIESRIVEWVVRSLFILRHAFLYETVNMVVAMDWCSHTTHGWIWFVICSFETVFPSVSDRLPKREKEKKKR